MFFSSELLTKRDSGFGLLWLAATLGPKSAFKKLPKRSVMSADITQLCELIATPAEPLALRLSSNLLVGAVRVYKIKQEIFMTDVTTCFNTLKRVVHEFKSVSASEAQLQMAQPCVKASTVTLHADPHAAFALDLDNMVADWHEYTNFDVARYGSPSDDDYNPHTARSKRKSKTSVVPPASAEVARANAHTLDEHHEFLLSTSLDASFAGSAIAVPSSSHPGGFAFQDSFFGAFGGLDLNEGIGDDLVRELGEGWGVSPIKDRAERDILPLEVPTNTVYAGMDYDIQGIDIDAMGSDVQNLELLPIIPLHQGGSLLVSVNAHLHSGGATNMPPKSPGAGCGDALHNKGDASKKMKRTRLVLDSRIELTDEELRAARMHYLEGQDTIRRGLQTKKLEKDSGGLVNDLLWSVPDSVQAKELIDFWVGQLRARVEARSVFYLDTLDEHPQPKRRKTKTDAAVTLVSKHTYVEGPAADDWVENNLPASVDPTFVYDVVDPGVETMQGANGLRSSEEPGQGRHAFRPPSALGEQFVGQIEQNSSSSRRSALFPWDNAGVSTSASEQGGGFRPRSSDRISVDHAETRLGPSLGRRESPLPSHPGSLRTDTGSPAIILRGSQVYEDFAFDVPGDHSVMESERSGDQVNLRTLEKHTSNFLEYIRMQYQSRSGSNPYLQFDDVVPRATSTAHVAAAALHYCLVLGTKGLIVLRQKTAYGQIAIRIK